MGFEPTRAEPNGLAVHRLNHSATSSTLVVKPSVYSFMGSSIWQTGIAIAKDIIEQWHLSPSIMLVRGTPMHWSKWHIGGFQLQQLVPENLIKWIHWRMKCARRTCNVNVQGNLRNWMDAVDVTQWIMSMCLIPFWHLVKASHWPETNSKWHLIKEPLILQLQCWSGESSVTQCVLACSTVGPNVN